MPDSAIADPAVFRNMSDVPGQALAYKLGPEHILGLRRRAEAELGGSFDPRAFHDGVLEPGALPLSVLDTHMVMWLEAQRRPRPNLLSTGSGSSCPGVMHPHHRTM